MPSDIFRDASLEQLASPDRLDQLMHITTPKGWLSLAGLGLLLVSVILWGFVGSVPTKLQGQGVLLKPDGVAEVVTTGRGRISDISVRTGDIIEAGQVVARLDQPQLRQQLQQAEAALQNIRVQRAKIDGLSRRETQLRIESLIETENNIRGEIDAKVQEILWSMNKIESRKELFDKGLITKQKLIRTQRELQAARQDTARKQTRLRKIRAERLALVAQGRQAATTRSFEMQEQEQHVDNLREQLRRRSQVVSPGKGRVLEIRAEAGALAREGEDILTLDPIGRGAQGLRSVLFVPARDGKRIKEGMAVQVAPATVRPEEHGRIKGVVTFVSRFPVTFESILKMVENKDLAKTLMRGGAPYEVRVRLTLDPDTPSRYAWTSSRGPDRRLNSGTLCNGTITINTRRPAQLVLPVLRESIGV